MLKLFVTEWEKQFQQNKTKQNDDETNHHNR